MNRRTFVTGLGALLAVPAAVGAQTGRRYRVAYVNETVETEEHKPQREAFRASMSNLGYVEGRNLIVDWRYADNNPSGCARWSMRRSAPVPTFCSHLRSSLS